MKRLILLAVVLMVLTVIGCGSRATPTLPTPGPAPTAFPIGTFTIQLGDNRWTMTLNENGSCTLVEDGVFVSTGAYKVTGDQLTWLQSAYCAQQGAERGTYAWSFDGMVLTFKQIQDGCKDRKAWLDNIQWMKKP